VWPRMRFVHTADWHLGRLFHTVHLTEDQAYVLDQFVALVDDVRPAAVLLAGDVYDRAVPPTEAVQLLDDVLQRIVHGLRVPVVMIAGNHDSPDRLGFGAGLLAAEGLHVAGRVSPEPLEIGFAGDAGEPPLRVTAIPYADPTETRAALGDPDIHDHEAALRALCGRVRPHPPGGRALLVGHAFVAGSLESDSERALSVGGAGTVPAAVFEGFDYVALGHLHRPQQAGLPSVRYSGSLLKQSFKEADQRKSVTIVDIDCVNFQKPPTVEEVVLQPRRDVRVLQGTLLDLIESGRSDDAPHDYVCARLTDKGAVLDALPRLREVYPNAVTIELAGLGDDDQRDLVVADPRDLPVGDHFARFFEHCNNEPLADGERQAFAALVERLQPGREP
jgi:DNA repair protein SbcD/Mre11